MKEEKKNRRPILVIILVFVGVILVGLTAAAVYAGRFMTREVGSLLSQYSSVEDQIPFGFETQESESIFDKGVLVTGVSPSSPAEEAGIRRGTIILEVNGKPVNSQIELTEMLAAEGSGQTVSITILNSSKPETKSVTLAAGPPLLGVRIAGVNLGSNFGRIPGEFDLSDIPEDFRFDPDNFDPNNLPFDPRDLGLPEDFSFGQGRLTAGVLVAEVIPAGAAENAGLQVGDLIDSVDSQKIEAVDELIQYLGSKNPGDSVTLSIVREEEPLEISVTLGDHPEAPGTGFLGIKPAPELPGFGQREGHGRFDPSGIPFQGELPVGGAVIVTIVDGSPASKTDLQVEDVITGVNGSPVNNVDELIQVISSHNPGETITLSLIRGNEEIEIDVTLGANPDDDSKAFLGVHLGAFYNVNLEKFGNGDGTLPEEFFYQLQPDFESGEFFEFPENFELPESFEELFPPEFFQQQGENRLSQQDA